MLPEELLKIQRLLDEVSKDEDSSKIYDLPEQLSKIILDNSTLNFAGKTEFACDLFKTIEKRLSFRTAVKFMDEYIYLSKCGETKYLEDTYESELLFCNLYNFLVDEKWRYSQNSNSPESYMERYDIYSDAEKAAEYAKYCWWRDKESTDSLNLYGNCMLNYLTLVANTPNHCAEAIEKGYYFLLNTKEKVFDNSDELPLRLYVEVEAELARVIYTSEQPRVLITNAISDFLSLIADGSPVYYELVDSLELLGSILLKQHEYPKALIAYEAAYNYFVFAKLEEDYFNLGSKILLNLVIVARELNDDKLYYKYQSALTDYLKKG